MANKPKKICTIVGARPQFVKAAAFSRVMAQSSTIEEHIVHTGQHHDYNMSKRFFEELEIPSLLCNLNIHGQTHGSMTGKMLTEIERVLHADSYDMALVYGDTNSTLAGALAAAKLHIPVVHIEAGLRSFNRQMPEEINRILTDHVSDLLFAPTHTALQNLHDENIRQGVFHSGDIMYDATLFAIEKGSTLSSITSELNLSNQEYTICTVHRSENTDDADTLKAIFDFVVMHSDGLPIIVPLHPRTKKAAHEAGIALDQFTVIEPVGYFDMHQLLNGAKAVFTDSGGLQKEAYFHRTPCITLRNETEWTETIDHGWNQLWHAEKNITEASEISEYGDGKAAEFICRKMDEFLQA